MSARCKGILLAAIGSVCWGGSGVATQFVLQCKEFSSELLVVVRLLLSGLLLLLIDAAGHFGDSFTIWHSRADGKRLLAFAVFGLLGVQYTYFTAIKLSNAPTATILQYLMPVVIVGWASLRSRSLPRLRELLCVLLAVLGAALLVTRGNFSALDISPSALAFGIASAFAAAFYTIQPKYLLSHWRSPLVIGWGMLIGGLLLSLVCPPWEFQGIWDFEAAMVFGYIILFGTVLAFWSYLESIKYIQASEVGTLASIEPLSVIFLSAVLLQVPMGCAELTGALLVLSAVFLLTRK